MMNIKISDIRDFKIDGVDRSDHPKFTDAYISDLTLKCGTELNDDQLDWFNTCGEFDEWIHESAFQSLI